MTLTTTQRGEDTAMLTAKLPASLRAAIRARADAATRETGVEVDATSVARTALEAYLAQPFSLDTLTAGRVVSGYPRMDLRCGAASKIQVNYRMPVSLVTALHARAEVGTRALRALGSDGRISFTDVLTAALTDELGGSPREVIETHRDQLLAALQDQDPR